MEDSGGARRWLTLVTINLGNFVTPLDTGIMTVVLPTIAADLGGLQYARLVLLIPLTSLLVESAFMPVFGRMSDKSGRKKWFLVGLALFSVGAFLSGDSATIFELLFYRVFQALGAALVLANGRALIADAFGSGERGLAFGIHVATLYLATALGVLLTASIVNVTSLVGWRYVFYLSGALAALAIPFTLAFVKESPKNPDRRMDWVGSLLFVVALGAALFVLTQVPEYGWGNFGVYVQDFRLPLLGLYYYLNLEVVIPLLPLAAAALAFTAAFFVWEWRAKSPLINLGMFRTNSMFMSTNVSALLIYTAHWGTLITLSFYLEEIEHFSILTSGLLLLVEPVAVLVAALIGGAIAARTGSRDPSIVGLGIAAAALGLLATLTATSSVLYIAFLLAMLGTGIGIFAPGNTNANLSSVDPKDRALANGVLGMLRFTGQSLSIALGSFLAGSVLLGQCFGQGCTYTPGQGAAALDVYFAVGCVIALAAVYFAYLGREAAGG